MPKVYQSFNRRIQAWVKYKFIKGKGFKPLNVKQRNPRVPFANINIKGQRP